MLLALSRYLLRVVEMGRREKATRNGSEGKERGRSIPTRSGQVHRARTEEERGRPEGRRYGGRLEPKRKRDFSLRRPTASQERSGKKKSACSV